ncbi:MAG TPA: hypothetical protein VM912_16055 [Terriglobales bacterium]|nr:hypothetical protein [Terriglobales bacterium]
MKQIARFIISLSLASALTAPIAMQAQDRDDHRDRDDRNRVYDRAHHDYHNWTPDEDRSYRQWYGETYSGRQYRDYRKLHRKDQDSYWNWRHNNDHDRDDRDRDKH